MDLEEFSTNDLWALEADQDGCPVKAHRITRVEPSLPGVPPDEARWTACGLRLTLKDRYGYWWVPRGELPLGLASANHCGIRSTEL